MHQPCLAMTHLPVSSDVIHWASLLYLFLFHQIKNRGNARFSDRAQMILISFFEQQPDETGKP